MGGEIGTHTYTHLINPPATTFTATTVGDTSAGSTQITLDHVPSFYGITVGMWLTGTGIGSNTQLPGSAGEGGAVANTQVIAVDNITNTITISYVPGGIWGRESGDHRRHTFRHDADLLHPAREHQLPGARDRHRPERDRQPLHLRLRVRPVEDRPADAARHADLRRRRAGRRRDRSHLPEHPAPISPPAPATPVMSPAAGPASNSGYPSAFGYISPTQQDFVYIAPNFTFDFTEIQYEGKTVAQAEADWAAQFSAIGANAAGTPVVVLPIHDYGVAAWNTTTIRPQDRPTPRRCTRTSSRRPIMPAMNS